LSWTNLENNKAHCVGVYLFRKVSVDSLIENLKKNCTKEAELTRKMVREKLQISDSDFEIETNTYKVSLHCPLMKFRLKLPGRSFKCKHVQCFDVESYLMMNEKKPTWNCPVCDQYVPYDTLIIDSLFIEILEKAKGLEEVQFNADAEWSKVIDDKSANNNNNNTSSSKNNKEVNSQDNSLSMNDNDNSATKKIKTDDDALVDLIGKRELNYFFY
jgi:E3 SUMO-protein ligase PIAS3